MLDFLFFQFPPSALKGLAYPRQSWQRLIQSRRGHLKSMAVFPRGSGATYLLFVSTLHTVKSFRWMHGTYKISCLHLLFLSPFQLDFHNYERLLLYKIKFAKNVVKCLKYFIRYEVSQMKYFAHFHNFLYFVLHRSCDPYLKDVTSHAIKSVVMKKIYHQPSYFHNTFNLETNFQVSKKQSIHLNMLSQKH